MMTEPTIHLEEENRVQTRALTKKMTTQLASRNAAAESEQDSSLDSQSDVERQPEKTTSLEEKTPQKINAFKLSILKLMEASNDEENLVANLQSLLKQQGAAIEAPETTEEETAPERDRPAQLDDLELAGPIFAPSFRRPSWNGHQPMGSQDLNFLARNNPNPETDEGHPESDQEEPARPEERSPTDLEVQQAIETLTAAFGSTFKPPAATKSLRRKPESQSGVRTTNSNRTTASQPPREATRTESESRNPITCRNNQPQDSNPLPTAPTMQNLRAKRRTGYSPAPRPPPSSFTRPETNGHDAGLAAITAPTNTGSPRLTSAAMLPIHESPRLTTASPPHLLPFFTGVPDTQQPCPPPRGDSGLTRAETSLPPTGLGLGTAAAAGSSLHSLQMGSTHAQSTPATREARYIDTSRYRLATDIPKPYCEFNHILDHRLLTSVSNHSSNSGTIFNNLTKLQSDGGNFIEWSQQLQIALMKENALFLINKPPQKPWSLEIDSVHHRAFCILLTTIPPTMYTTIDDDLTVFDIVQKLYSLFYSQSRATTTRISREFHSARHKPGVPISEHILRLSALRAELMQRGEIITEESLMSVIINSLDSSWDNFMTQLDSLSLQHLSLGTLTNKLIAEDNLRRDRHLSRGDSRPTKRVEFQDRARNTPECYSCGSRNHLRKDCHRNSRNRGHNDTRGGRSPERRDRGHNETRGRQSPEHRHFRERGRGWSPNPRRHYERRDSSRDSHPGASYGLRHDDSEIKQRIDRDTWILDSGATNHTTCNPKLLNSLTETDFKLKMANQSKVQVLGKGNTYIPQIGEIEGVLYVPEIPHNILATTKLTQNPDTEIVLRDGRAYVFKQGKEIGKVTTQEGLHHFTPCTSKGGSINTSTDQEREGNTETEGVHQETTDSGSNTNKPVSIGKPMHDNCAHLLHRKLGHISFPIVKKMSECTEGLQLKNCENYLECSICKRSKIKVKARPKKSERTTESPFQLVHMDLVGPFRPSIRHKKRFFLTIVDDYTRYGYVYSLRHKNEVFQRFKEFHKRTELQHNTKIKQIMTDRGSEFMAKEFTRWLREQGIAHYTSSPFSPFQNGVAERKNGVLQTMMRCVLEDAGMGQSFWSEALHYSNYTLNRLWSSSINKTPYEMLYKRKPNLSHLHIFGAPADVHIPRQLRRKGEKVSKRLRFVGYEPGTKGYRFIDNNNRFVVSRSANFHEHSNWSRIHSNDTFTNGDTHDHDQRGEGTKTHKNNHHHSINTKEWKEEHPTLKLDSLTSKEANHMHETDTPPSRPVRENRNKLPKRLEDYVMTIHGNYTTPNSYEDIINLPQEEREKWRSAMEREMESLRDLHVYTPAEVPESKKPIGTKWVFRIKTLEDNKALYKARLVAQGFAQRYPEDYTDTYSPTVRAESVKSALVVATILGLEVFQFDVQTAYLHAELDKEIYVKAPPGYNEGENKTWLLNKSLYGLKQSGKRWYDCLAKALRSMGFEATSADKCLFTKRENNSFEGILVYVDDILYMGKHKEKCDKFATELGSHFSLKSLGKIDKYLGVHVTKTDKGFRLSQKEKIIELLSKCNMSEAKPSETPMQPDFLKNMYDDSGIFTDNKLYRSTIGSLLYIANWTRPDIALAVNLLSRHVSKPTTSHWEAIKRLLRYLKFSINAQLCLEPEVSKKPKLTCYADADWAGDIKSRKSTSGYVLFLNGSPIHWYTGKQKLVATSTTEAEFVCLSKAANNLVWFDDLLSDIWTEPTYPIIIHEDNRAAIEISKADAVGQRSRHIDIKYKHVRQFCEIGFIKAVHCDTEEQTADILTKPLPHKQHAYLTSKICIHM